MQKKTIAGTTPVTPWRTHCERAPHLFAPLTGSHVQTRRAERWEADAIARLTCDFELTDVRAVALRSIAELRECTVRQVAMFFDIEGEIVVAAISLLPEATAVSVPKLATTSLIKAA